MSAVRTPAGISLHAAGGKVADELAKHYDRVYITVPIKSQQGPSPGKYVVVSDNVEVIPQPYFETSKQALRQIVGIARAYLRICRKVGRGDLFIRGMAPYVGLLYAAAYLFKCNVCHWIVGDPISLLRTHRRAGRMADALSLAYAYQDRAFARLGRSLVSGAFVCNGEPLGKAYRSPRTVVTASSTTTQEEFFERGDTCTGDLIRILYVGYVRPEKGVQYLIEAVGRLKTKRPWELVIVGPWEQYPTYKRLLDDIADAAGVTQKIRWAGYVPLGPRLYEYLRSSDILVLPTLSEGTPHVLVEARANSLPLVSTNVGGIPTSVTSGFDAILVPPKDSQALAEAIDRIIEDGALRRSLIANGLAAARRLTVDCFARTVLAALGRKPACE